jgi:hypothetical protein
MNESMVEKPVSSYSAFLLMRDIFSVGDSMIFSVVSTRVSLVSSRFISSFGEVVILVLLKGVVPYFRYSSRPNHAVLRFSDPFTQLLTRNKEIISVASGVYRGPSQIFTGKNRFPFK